MRILFTAVLVDAALGAHLLLAQPSAVANVTPKFDVADVHRSARATNPYTWMAGGMLRGERFDLRKATLLELIHFAYDVEPEAIVGGPDWLAIQRWDIAAKAKAGTGQAELKGMLQALLAERFGLVVRKDTRQLPAFVLSANGAKPGGTRVTKMTQASGVGASGCQEQQQQPDSKLYTYFCRNITMDGFANELTGMLWDYSNPPVVNSTGLTGAWDFDLEWHRRAQVQPAGVARTTAFQAMDKQLGLTMATGTVTAPAVVVERAHEASANVANIAQLLPPREAQFEVASVRLSKLTKQEAFDTSKDGTLTVRGAALGDLLVHSWDVDYSHGDDYVIGGARWGEGQRYDIVAKPPSVSGATITGQAWRDDQQREMLKNLLIERLQIKYHYEQRPSKAYTLVATPEAKRKLKKAEPGRRSKCEEVRGVIANDPRDLHPELPNLVMCQNTTMAQFAAQLLGLAPAYFIQEVQDETGISGAYDFTMSYSSYFQMFGNVAQPAASANGEPTPPRPGLSLFDAVQKQLGVKLEQRKRPIPVVVIERMEKVPLEN